MTTTKPTATREVRGYVYIYPSAMNKLNELGIYPTKAVMSNGNHESFDYPAEYASEFNYKPGHVGCRGVFKLATEIKG